MLRTVTSRDGTRIAFETSGQGPALILVGGATSTRMYDGPYIELLASDFTVISYDRRGRGDSEDTPPYAVEREVEDLAALIDAAGGSAFVYGISSGAGLALEAANRGVPIAKLAIYEPPFIVDDTREPVPADLREQLEALLAAGARGDALELFFTKAVGLPPEFVAPMRNDPMWPALEAVAHTLPYDVAIMGDGMSGKPLPTSRVAGVTIPTLVADGDRSPLWMRNGTKAVADAIPQAEYRTLADQDHAVAPEALVPLLKEFFLGSGGEAGGA